MALTKKRYNELDELAISIRLDYDFLDDKFDIEKFSDILDVQKYSYSELKQESLEFIDSIKALEDGFILKEQNQLFDSPYIFFEDDINEKRKFFTYTHELSHILLGHKDENHSIQEEEANHTAIQLIAPYCLLMIKIYLGYEQRDISDIFNISMEATEYAIRHTRNRIKRHGFTFKTYEIEFLNKYLEKHYKKNLFEMMEEEFDSECLKFAY